MKKKNKAIELENVTFKYKENSQLILKDFSLSINEGDWVTLLGHNGSGKSTISKIMAGLLKINSGKVRIFGEEYTEENIFELRKLISTVFQNPDSQFVGASVEDDIAFGLENQAFEPKLMKEKIFSVLKDVDMLDSAEAAPHDLSGGQKQRIAIAGVIAISPKIVVFDEATAMLDPQSTKKINDLMKILNKENKMTIINITHNMNETLWSDRVVIIEKGKIQFDGPPEKILFDEEKLVSLNLEAPYLAKISLQAFKHGLCDKKSLKKEEILKCLK